METCNFLTGFIGIMSLYGIFIIWPFFYLVYIGIMLEFNNRGQDYEVMRKLIFLNEIVKNNN